MDSIKNNNKGLGEVSFSCYLETEEENFIQKLTNSAAYTNHSITSSPEFPSVRSLLQRTRADQEDEIGVFDAEKYYNMKLEEGPIIVVDTASDPAHHQVDLAQSKIKSRPGTSSVSSEASSNSQTSLLRTYQMKPSQDNNKQRKLPGKGFFKGLSCIGYCMDKKSVHINQNVDLSGMVLGKEYRKERIQSTAADTGSNSIKVKDEFMPIQIANSGVQNLAVPKNLAKRIEEEDPRKSLDVFGTQKLNKEVIEKNLERNLSMLSWDAIPKSSGLPKSSVKSQVYEDIESDASSDLFEIENIYGSSTRQPDFRRQTSNGGMSSSSCMSPTLYELPSETSIEWSVVTASAAVDCLVVSGYDEKKLAENIGTTPRFAKTNSIDKDTMQGSRPIKLLGYNSYKSTGSS